MSTPPELLSPAGGFDAALAAFQYGADAVYLGLPRFSARADADNLTPDRLRVLLAYARTFSPAKKIYVTFNTLVCDAEIDDALATLDLLADLAPDGVIVQDLGIARLIREHFPSLPLHASTQLAAHSLDGVLALKSLGFTRVVLARELTCDEIRRIVRQCGVEIEVFIHGALCYSYSGLCLFSSHATGRSGNRGRCAYCCREAFAAPGATSRYPFSMKDLALAPILDTLTATGAHALKIEGRMKNPLYVACVTDYYRRKLDRSLTPGDEARLIQDLQTIFSRPWTTLYADGASTPIDPLSIGHRGAYIGRVEAVLRDRDGTRWLRFTTRRALEKHDGLQIELPDGGKPFGCAVNLLRAAGSAHTVIALPADATAEVALPLDAPAPIPRGAPVFCSASQAVRRAYPIRSLREAELSAGRPADFTVTLSPDGIAVTAASSPAITAGGGVRAGRAIAVTVAASPAITVTASLPYALTPSRQPGQTEAAVRKAFGRLGESGWTLNTLAVRDPDHCYAPPSKLNEARRAALAALTRAHQHHRAQHLLRIRAAFTPPDAVAAAAFTPPDTVAAAAFTPLVLKTRPDTPPPDTDTLRAFDTVVLAIGHTPYPALAPRLAQWAQARTSNSELRASNSALILALPLISHDAERAELRQTVTRLRADGWAAWECADLAGHHLLRELGITPASSDWSLYALNRVAATELAHFGIRSFVLSPELDLATIRTLASHANPVPELIAYQHTPLFISETAPCIPETAAASPLALADRRNRAFITHHLDGRWVTVSASPLCLAGYLAQTLCTRLRIDLSWSPDPAHRALPATLRALRADTPLPSSHTANLLRGFGGKEMKDDAGIAARIAERHEQECPCHLKKEAGGKRE